MDLDLGENDSIDNKELLNQFEVNSDGCSRDIFMDED